MKKHCRCLICGFIRYNSVEMDQCPRCSNRDIQKMTPSFSNKKEALELFCNAFNITVDSSSGIKIKQALDIILG